MRREVDAAIEVWLATISPGSTAFGETVRPDSIELEPTVAASSGGDRATVARSGLSTWMGSLPRIELAHAGRAEAGAADLELLGVLGEGGMGRVYEARQVSIGRHVAVKVLHDARSEAAGTLLREARLSGALEHPGIVPVHALGVDAEGQPVLVMKRVEGTSWQDLLDDPAHPAWAELSTLPPSRLRAHLEILAHVAETLAFAHARGIVHRDIKPANVLVGRYGEIYLVDWGIALDLSRRDEEPIAPVGTPLFLAPEMVLGDPRDVDERTDVYLLGATLHTLLARSPRHPGTTMREVLERATRSAPFDYGPEVPDELARLANDATACEPSARPATALAFRSRLIEYFAHLGSTELTERGEQRSEQASAALAEADTATTPEARTAARNLARLRLAEARFAFEQALSPWPENRAARANLEEALARSVELELGDGAVGAARVLLAGSALERPDLLERIEQAERSTAAREAERQRLLLQAERHRPQRAAGGRTLLLIVLAAMAAGLAFGLREARMGDDPTVSARSPLFPLLVCLAFAPIAWFSRRSIRASAFNRNMIASVGLTLVLASALRTLGYLFRTDIAHIMSFELMMFAALMGFLGLFVARVFFWAMAATVVCAGLSALFTDQLEFFYVGAPVSLVIASHLAGRERATTAQERSPGDAAS